MTTETTQRRSSAAAELNERCPHVPAAQIVDSLAVGMSHLRDLLLSRIHEDVERFFGLDSMTAPISDRDEKSQVRNARVEIEVFSAIVVADEIATQSYLQAAEKWLLDWLFRLRLGDSHQSVTAPRVEYYHSPTVDERRLKFVSVLQRTVPESVKAPLVLFRLYPRAVRISTALAFGDAPHAAALRHDQTLFLPAVRDCHECQGRVLDNEEICRVCGNPVWEFAWLQAD